MVADGVEHRAVRRFTVPTSSRRVTQAVQEGRRSPGPNGPKGCERLSRLGHRSSRARAVWSSVTRTFGRMPISSPCTRTSARPSTLWRPPATRQRRRAACSFSKETATLRRLRLSTICWPPGGPQRPARRPAGARSGRTRRPRRWGRPVACGRGSVIRRLPTGDWTRPGASCVARATRRMAAGELPKRRTDHRHVKGLVGGRKFE